jgi:hypothetical protein
LIRLLEQHFHLALKDIYATNLFPFVKPGPSNASIPIADMVRAAQAFGLPQLDIVKPKIAICLGLDTFNALRVACGHDMVNKLAEGIDSPILHGESIIFCQAHTGQLGQNNRNRGRVDRVSKDWSKMVSCYNAMPDNRAELNEWFRKWLESQQDDSGKAGAPVEGDLPESALVEAADKRFRALDAEEVGTGKGAEDSFRRGWEEAQRDETLPIDRLWEGVDVE